MPLQLQSIVKDSISEVLETMFFIGVDFQGNAPPPEACDFVSAIRLSSGNEQAEISFRVTGKFGRMVAANFLGTGEETVQTEEVEDSLKEFANMVAGNCLTKTDEKGWRLGIPHAERTGGGAEGGDGPGAERAFSFLGDPVGTVSVRPGPFV